MIESDKKAIYVKELYNRWHDARKEWEDHAREDIDFYLGNHFSEAEADELASRNQSNIPLDRIYSAIEQFKAIITSKPPKFSAMPREDSDSDLASVWKTILDYIWNISDGNEVFKQTIHDYSVTGLGYFYAYVDREADYGRGEVKFTYVDPFRVVIDPNARSRYFDDATGMMLSTIFTKFQLLDLYPQLSEEQEDGKMMIDLIETFREDETWPSATNKRTVGTFTPDYIKDKDTGEGSERYQLIEHFSKVKVPYYRILDMQSGEERILDLKNMEKFLAEPKIANALEQGLVDVVEVQQTRIKLTCTLGQTVLYEYILNTDKYPIVPVPNIWTNTPYPMSDVRKNKDFQRFLNKTMSLITSHAQASSGLKLLIPQGSVDDIEELEKNWANPNATIEYDPSFGEPHFPSPQPLSNSVMQLPALIEKYIDLNMGIFEMMQGNSAVAPNTSSATMMLEDFGQRRSKSKLRDIEGSLRRLGQVVYNLSKEHYNYKKVFRVAQPNNDMSEYMVNFYNDKSQAISEMQNDLTIGQYDVNIIGNSTMPSNKWGEWSIYMEAYQSGLIDQTEALMKTDIFDKEGVLQRMDIVAKLQSQLQQSQEQIKNLQGDLQTAHRESISSRKKVEVEKFKTELKSQESQSKSANNLAVGKLEQAVKLEAEKLRLRSQAQDKQERLLKKESKMDNALENNNLEEGQVNDNVGQDEATQQQESGGDWESQAKYFQSEKDKLQAENQKLKQYEQVGQMLESRPDIVNTISGMVQGGQPAPEARVELSKDEFDPWEAYNDPSSKSYKFRQQELQDTINTAVQSQVGDVKKEVGMSKLQTELANKGLNPEQITSFMDFASKNPAEYGIDGAINMWQSVTQNSTEAGSNNNPLDTIRQNQAVPQQAGILNGEQPVKKDDKDSMWDSITKAGSRTNVL